MNNGELVFTLWDVGHGISIWINTPNGRNHWIDLGYEPEERFSPSEHVHENYGVGEGEIDYLIISHPHKDHLEDLPEFLDNFGNPKYLLRNKTVPDEESFGEEDREYQKAYAELCKHFSSPVSDEESPKNPNNNGNIQYATDFLPHGESGGVTIEENDTSIVVMLKYKDVLFVCPGDIEPKGWNELWRLKSSSFNSIISGAEYRFLVAPHHGRKSGYCKEMMDVINPHATFISDVWGQSETHRAFREDPIGIVVDGALKRYFSTKRGGRIQVKVFESGHLSIDQQ